LNFLAHFHLSGADRELAIGNFLGDFLRQNQVVELPTRIQQGFELHRFIDQFTDVHPIVARSKERARPTVHKYAPVLVDIYYDYFLANQWSNYSELSLREATQHYYNWIEHYMELLPSRALRFFGYVKQYDIFYAYQTHEGLHRTLSGMSRRASFVSNLEQGLEHLLAHEAAYEADFNVFYPELVAAVTQYIHTTTDHS